jgi:enoyl-[acyl-carrier-protein] reductase (NADH)
MKKILILPIVLLSIALSAQKTKNDPEISKYVGQVNRDSLKAHVEKLVSFGTRHTMSSTTDAMDCANYCVSLFSDLTRKVTMQNLFHDGGFSNTGVSQKIVDKFEDFEG